MKFINKLKKATHHQFISERHVRSLFPQKELDRLQAAIGQSELNHLGQIRFVVESGWSWQDVWQEKSTRERAMEWFAISGTWDTEHNIGVLIYLSFADRAIEIIADRGIAKKVDNQIWQDICLQMRDYFVQKNYVLGLETGLTEVNKVLETHFPRDNQTLDNELSDEVIVK